MADLKYIGKNILNHDLILKKGDISGSSSSTGSFGRIDVADNISADSFTGTFDGALSSSAQIASDISGSFGADSASFSTRVTNLKTDSGSFSTRVTKNEGTGSKILAGQLEFANITASGNITADGNISGSATSTGSFGDVKVGPYIKLEGRTGDVWAGTYNSTSGKAMLTKSGTQVRIGEIEAESSAHPLHIYSAGSSIANFANSAGGTLTLGSTLIKSDDGSYFPNAVGFGAVADNSYTIDMGGTPLLGFKRSTTRVGYIQTTSDNDLDISTNASGLKLRLNVFNNGEIHTGTGKFVLGGDISGSLTSTGSFGELHIADRIGVNQTNPASLIHVKAPTTSDDAGITFSSAHPYNWAIGTDAGAGHYFKITNADTPGGGTDYLSFGGGSITFGTGVTNVVINSDEISVGNAIRHIDDPDTSIEFTSNQIDFQTDDQSMLLTPNHLSGSATNGKGFSGSFNHVIVANKITGSATSTGSFGNLKIAGMSIPDVKILSSSIATNISSLSASSAARDTLSEATSSKILNGQLEFTNITGSGHISMSLSSTGSFGRVSATTIGGHSPLRIDSDTTFTNSITASGHISGSLSSTGSIGRIEVSSIGSHNTLFLDSNQITASSETDILIDGKLELQSGSLLGDVHIRTNDNLMRIGKSTSGLVMSGSDEVSRFATASDGSIIDIGFTVRDEEGNLTLTGDGDGIHVDGNNYWYNNTFYRVGSKHHSLEYDTVNLRYKGQVFAQTGSIDGELYITTGASGSMFIGKYTGGLPSSGSGTVSRFATGSDGSIIDLGFTTVDEDGNTVFLTTGDGIIVDDTNYWYTTGHFKLGDTYNFINWDTNNLTISGTFTGDGSGITGLTADTPSGTVSSSAQLASAISGSFTSVSASLAARISASAGSSGGSTPAGTVSSSAQLATSISGSFTGVSASLSTRISSSDASLTTISASLAARIAVEEAEGGDSGFSSAGISGSWKGVIGSGSLNNISGSAISTGSFGKIIVDDVLSIRGFTNVSTSLAAAVAGGDNLGNHTATQDINLNGFSLKGINNITASGNISGSNINILGVDTVTSTTGSFTKAHITDKVAIGHTTPISPLHTQVSTVSYSHTYGYQEKGITIEADESMLQLIANDNNSHGGSILLRYGNNVFATVANTTADDLEFSYAVTSGNNFNMHGGGSQVTSFKKIMALNKGGNVTIGGNITADGNISGSASSTGSFGELHIADKIGIGDTSPGSKLVVVGTGDNARFGSTSDGIVLGHGSGFGSIQGTDTEGSAYNALKFRTSGNYAMTIDTSDNVIFNTANQKISGSATSTGSFGRVAAVRKVNIGSVPENWTEQLNILGTTSTTGIKVQAPSSGNAQIKLYSNNGGSNNDFWYMQATNGGTFDIVNYGPGSFTNMVSIAANTGHVEVRGNVSGSATSTGSFGKLLGDGSEITNVTSTVPTGTVSGSAQLSTAISGSFTSTSASFSTRLTTRESYLTQSFSDGTAALISGSADSTGSIGVIQTPLEGRVISNFTELIRVTVVSDGGNHYAFEGATTPSLQVSEGKTYRFDISDSTVGSHPFRFSTVQDGGHNGGSAYTTGVTVVGTQGNNGAYVELKVTKATVNHLYYYCTSHPGMGNDGKIMKNDLTNLHMISGSAQSTGSLGSLKISGASVDFTNLPTSDPGVAGRLWNDSNALKISAG